MFTSEPSLTQRIERLIRDTPIIDARTQIRLDQPNAPDLASLMGHDGVQTELRAVGMQPGDLEPSLPADERVRRAIPYLARMRNTAASWCFYRVLRDLYDFHDPNLTESNHRDVFDHVAATARDPQWAGRVLRERAHVEMFVTGLENKSVDPSKNLPQARYMVDAGELVCPGWMEKGVLLGELPAIIGPEIGISATLTRRLRDVLDATIRGDVRFTEIALPKGRFLEPNQAATSAILARVTAGEMPTDHENDELIEFVTWTLLEWHHDHGKAMQITVRADPNYGEENIPRYRESWTQAIARVFRRFGNARFDLLMAPGVPTAELVSLAREIPNVYASCDWRSNFAAPMIENDLAIRLQLAPMSKFAAFSSDAEYVEWSYGRLQLVSKAMASTLAHLIEAGYYEEDEVPPILRQILYQTPRDIYDLA